LDGGGFCIALLRDSAQQLGQQPEAFEVSAYVYLLMDRPAKDIAFDTGSGRRNVDCGNSKRNCRE
jgi:hypothetical protein